MYTNIGKKLKGLAKGSGIATACIYGVIGLILALLVGRYSPLLAIIIILLAVMFAVISIISTWKTYALGQLVESIQTIELMMAGKTHEQAKQILGVVSNIPYSSTTSNYSPSVPSDHGFVPSPQPAQNNQYSSSSNVDISKTEIKICPKCKTQNPKSSRFCRSCGEVI